MSFLIEISCSSSFLWRMVRQWGIAYRLKMLLDMLVLALQSEQNQAYHYPEHHQNNPRCFIVIMPMSQLDDSFESAFLTLPIQHSPRTRSLYLQSTPSSSPLIDRPWPSLSCLPALPELYRILTSVTLNTLLNISVADDPFYQRVKNQLNHLKLNLQIQRQHAGRVWHCDKRRLQASAVHFTLHLRTFLASIISDGSRNISEAQQRSHLCLRLEQLEQLMNSLVKHLQQIHKAMLDPKHFKEEQSLTIEFFKGLTELMANLPIMRRSQILQVPPLMQYIVLTLQIEQQKGGLASIPEQIHTPVPQRKASQTRKPAKSQTRQSRTLTPPQMNRKYSITSHLRLNKSGLKDESFDDSDKSRSNTLDHTTLTVVSQANNKACFPAKKGPVRKKAREVMRNSNSQWRSVNVEEPEDERLQNQSSCKETLKEEQNSQVLTRKLRTINIDTGRPHGWRLAKQFLNLRIAEKQISHLLSSE